MCNSHRPRVSLALLATAWLLTSTAIPCWAGFPSDPPTLDPKTYLSPSGRFALFVNPSHPHGAGKGHYRLTRDGREVWSSEKGFTLWDARITDEGVAAGYAYSLGKGSWKGSGDLHVVILDEQGRTRLDQITKRQGRPEQFADPTVAGIVLDAANDRLVIRIHDADFIRDIQSWWIFRISQGTPQARFAPVTQMTDALADRAKGLQTSLIAAEPVAGTSLTLLNWSCYDAAKDVGPWSMFTLIDLDGKPIWKRTFPDEGEIVDGPSAAGRFDLLDVVGSRHLVFTTRRDHDGHWAITESASLPILGQAVRPGTPLKVLGRIKLNSTQQETTSLFQAIDDFTFDALGRIVFLDRKQTPPKLMHVDPAGKVLDAISLPITSDEDKSYLHRFVHAGENRFVIIRQSASRDEEKSEAWRIDFNTRQITPIPGFNLATVTDLVGFADGGFTVKSGMYGSGIITTFDKTGRKIGAWSSSFPSPPQDMAITSSGEVAVLFEPSSPSIRLFDQAGKHLRTILLKNTWGRRPTYVTNITADLEGGLLVHDSQGSPPIVRMRSDGTIRAQLTPKYADSRALRSEPMRVAPDGKLWTTDGYALLRLDDAGVVDRVLGNPLTPDRLGQIEMVHIDHNGRIYAADARTGSIHLFDPQGRWLRVCKPDPTDLQTAIGPSITVEGNGNFYVEPNQYGSHKVGRYIHFSGQGERLGIEVLPFDSVSQKLYCQPATGNRWIVTYDGIDLADRNNVVLRTIERCADGRWLEHPGAAAVAQDGAIAVIARDAINIYTPKGDPVRTILLPQGVEGSGTKIAYDGQRVAILSKCEILLFDASGRVLRRSSVVEEDSRVSCHTWRLFLAPGGHEIRLFDGRRTIIRYEIPDA